MYNSNMTIDISSLTSEKIKAGQFKKSLSEIYALKKVVENSAWHEKQDVFEHTMAVLEQLESLLKIKIFKPSKRKILQRQLNKRVGNYTRKDLLIVSTLLHDIAKPVTAIKDKTGIVRCPGHEFFGSDMVKSFSIRLGLDKKDEDFVKRIVYSHGLIVEVLNQIMDKSDKEYYLNSFKNVVGDIYYELLLLFYSDLLGSDLKRLNPKEYKIRQKLTFDFLQNN